MNLWLIILILILLIVTFFVLNPKNSIETFDPNMYYNLDYSRVYPSLYAYSYKTPGRFFDSLDNPNDAFNPSVNRNSDYSYIAMHEYLQNQMNGPSSGPRTYPAYRDRRSLPIINLPPVDPRTFTYASPLPPGACIQNSLDNNISLDFALKHCTR